MPRANFQDADWCLGDLFIKPALPIGYMSGEVVVGECISACLALLPALAGMAATKGCGSLINKAKLCQVMAMGVVRPVVIDAGVDVDLQDSQGILYRFAKLK